MHYMRWLLRAKRWAHRPPSEGRVKLVIGLILFCCALAAVERWVGWPAWATLDPTGPRGIAR